MLKIGNAGEVKVFSVGVVCLKTNTGTTLVLQNIKYALDISLILISVGQLDKNGYRNDLFNGWWKLTKGSLVVAQVRKYSNLFCQKFRPKRDLLGICPEFLIIFGVFLLGKGKHNFSISCESFF